MVYEPGEVTVVADKNGAKWAEDSVRTTGPASRIELSSDRYTMDADDLDLVFITANVTDDEGLTVPTADYPIEFAVSVPGEIVATANGDSANMQAFPSSVRDAFDGRCLAVVCAPRGAASTVRITARSLGLDEHTTAIRTTGPNELE